MSSEKSGKAREEKTIEFAVNQCSLGWILVAGSKAGLCFIALGDDPEVLPQKLQDRFPRAILTSGNQAFEQTVARVVELVDHPSAGLDVPLDVQGTAFQRLVWQNLREIPCGQTVTYADIARNIGKPNAARAVAQACAANKLAVVIPCHRVVRTDGSLGGYEWGTARKRKLLELEKAEFRNHPIL